jgi:fibro-slime domain-containing protein
MILVAAGCSNSTIQAGGPGGKTGDGTDDAGTVGPGGRSGGGFVPPDALLDQMVDTVPPPASVWPPEGFTNVTDVSFGAYALGPQLGDKGSLGESGMGGLTNGHCTAMIGVVRDFKMSTTEGGHPDFEAFQGGDPGIVADRLGPDGKPVYADHPNGKTSTTAGKENFDQWYRDVPGVNMSYLVAFHFVQNGRVMTFAASQGNEGKPDSFYFPVDNAGFGNQWMYHNFSFTTELHTSFKYNGGEVFTFQGDDDVFVYMNQRLAVDLGGVHGQDTKTVDLDAQAAALGITKGNVYELAIFNAERHMGQSNFRIDTTMAFADCGRVGDIVY